MSSVQRVYNSVWFQGCCAEAEIKEERKAKKRLTLSSGSVFLSDLYIIASYFGFELMGLEPIGADLDGDVNGEVLQGKSVLHLAEDYVAHLFLLGTVEVEDKFVVDLEYHAGAQVVSAKLVMDAHHRYLNHVGRGTLDGHIDGIALGEGAGVVVAGVDVEEVATAAKEGLRVAVGTGELLAVFDELLDVRILGEVFVDKRGGFLAGDRELLAETER